MEDLRKLFEPVMSVKRLDLPKESFYLIEDEKRKCYVVPSWVLGLFPTYKDPWMGYKVNRKVWVNLVNESGGEWIKIDGVWL